MVTLPITLLSVGSTRSKSVFHGGSNEPAADMARSKALTAVVISCDFNCVTLHEVSALTRTLCSPLVSGAHSFNVVKSWSMHQQKDANFLQNVPNGSSLKQLPVPPLHAVAARGIPHNRQRCSRGYRGRSPPEGFGALKVLSVAPTIRYFPVNHALNRHNTAYLGPAEYPNDLHGGHYSNSSWSPRPIWGRLAYAPLAGRGVLKRLYYTYTSNVDSPARNHRLAVTGRRSSDICRAVTLHRSAFIRFEGSFRHPRQDPTRTIAGIDDTHCAGARPQT